MIGTLHRDLNIFLFSGRLARGARWTACTIVLDRCELEAFPLSRCLYES